MKIKLNDLTPRERELFDAFLAGFDASGEGYNAEYPYGDHGVDPVPKLLPKFRAWFRSLNKKRAKKRIAR